MVTEPEIDYFRVQEIANKWKLDYNTLCAAMRDYVSQPKADEPLIDGYPLYSGLPPPLPPKSEAEKDAVDLLFALQDAWPYVHQWCTIESKKNRIIKLLRKHGDFADL